jgi:hypothetical protein
VGQTAVAYYWKVCACSLEIDFRDYVSSTCNNRSFVVDTTTFGPQQVNKLDWATMNVAARQPAIVRRSSGHPGVLTQLVRRFWLGSGGSQAAIRESQAKLFEGLVETPMRQRTEVLNCVDTLLDDTDPEQVNLLIAGTGFLFIYTWYVLI